MFRRRLLQQALAVPKPIASYECYDLTNEGMAENPVLTDLTGNGHDISCNNFAWSGMSGIGGYPVPPVSTASSKEGNELISQYSVRVTKTGYTGMKLCNLKQNESVTFKYRIEGVKEDYKLWLYTYLSGVPTEIKQIIEDGDYEDTVTNTNENIVVVYLASRTLTEIPDMDMTITILPEHKGALVSDGVDDYGICENFPILTKEKGYTVVAVRKWLNKEKDQVFLCKANNSNHGAFLFECLEGNVYKIYSYGQLTRVNEFPDLFSHQKTNQYNTTSIGVGYYTDGSTLFLFRGRKEYPYYCETALYALEIYDRDLTPYQIEAVKKRLMDKYNNPEDTTSDWYGVEWYTNQSPSRVMRIGNMNLHRTLPIQSGMYRCILNDNGEEVYKLDPNDSTKKEDGTPAVLDGTDGQVMVYIPVFYARFESKGYRRHVKLSDHYKPGFIKMGGCYISAYEATIDRTTSGTPKLASVVNETANFRGGNNNAEWDGSYRSLLGMPATVTSLTNFRTYARNRKADNTEWNCMDYHAYKALYWLYVVEYANRNCQLDFNDALTSEGFRQGGLGAGVTNINGTKWSTFNDSYPFIKCGYTNSLGNKTGIVAYTMPDEYDAETPLTTYVPSYRGVENPFGHIWKWADGLHIRIQSEEAGGRSILYTADNPASYQDSNYDGYDEVGDIARTAGYVKDILFDEGEMLPTITTGSGSTKDFSDYFYTNIPASSEVLRGVLFGGHASSGASAGFAYANVNDAPSNRVANVGSRLCYIPNNQLVTNN